MTDEYKGGGQKGAKAPKMDRPVDESARSANGKHESAAVLKCYERYIAEGMGHRTAMSLAIAETKGK